MYFTHPIFKWALQYIGGSWFYTALTHVFMFLMRMPTLRFPGARCALARALRARSPSHQPKAPSLSFVASPENPRFSIIIFSTILITCNSSRLCGYCLPCSLPNAINSSHHGVIFPCINEYHTSENPRVPGRTKRPHARSAAQYGSGREPSACCRRNGRCWCSITCWYLHRKRNIILIIKSSRRICRERCCMGVPPCQSTCLLINQLWRKAGKTTSINCMLML